MPEQKRSYREVYEQKMRELSHEVYAQHEIKDSIGVGRWYLAKRRGNSWSFEYATEVICLTNRALYVGGDTDVVVFAYGPDDHHDRLLWMGNQRMTTGYMVQKAAIGTGGSELVTVWDTECAEYEIRKALDDGFLELTESDREELRDALDCAHDGEYAVWNALPSDAWEYLPDLGKVPAVKVFYAQAAVRRVCELLGLIHNASDEDHITRSEDLIRHIPRPEDMHGYCDQFGGSDYD